LKLQSVQSAIAESYLATQVAIKDAIYDVHDPVKVAAQQIHLFLKGNVSKLLPFSVSAACFSPAILAVIQRENFPIKLILQKSISYFTT
jgi:hypothetical protein